MMDLQHQADHEKDLSSIQHRPHGLGNAAPGPKVPLRLEVKNVTSHLFLNRGYRGALGVDIFGGVKTLYD